MSFSICVVGCGRLANEMHGPALRLYASRHPGTVLAGCCDRDPGKAAAFREVFGFRSSYTDADAMLDAERPDAVCLLVPPAAAQEAAVRILDKGFPLITEKPPGLTAEETRRIIEAASRARVPTRVALNRRYMPLVVRLRQMACTPERSWIEHIDLDFYRVGRTDPDFSTTAIHGIDLVRFLAGSPYTEIRISYRDHAGLLVPDITLECAFASGCTARVCFRPASGIEIERIVLTGTGRTVVAELPGWEPEDPPGRIMDSGKGRPRIDVDGASLLTSPEPCEKLGFYGENAGFFDSLRARAVPGGGVEDSLQTVEVAAGLRSRAAFIGF